MKGPITLGLLLTHAASSARAWWSFANPAVLAYERLDPVMQAGITSNHTHAFYGADSLTHTFSEAAVKKTQCTTVSVQADKSWYWYPLMYYKWTNGSFSHIPSAPTFYYLQRSQPGEQIKAFPTGLLMIGGNPYHRIYNASNVPDTAIAYTCMGSGDESKRPDFPDRNCPGGLRGTVTFPSCWDGKNLMKPDLSHLSYPNEAYEGGLCPATHPVRLMTLMYEIWYNVQNFEYRKGAWTLSFGDNEGLGLHADFAAGLDTKVLQQAIDQCVQSGTVETCAPLVKSQNNKVAQACRIKSQVVNEDVGINHPIVHLPGDNVPWGGDGPKPTECNYCPPTQPGYISPNSTLASGFKVVGCVEEGVSGRLLPDAFLSDEQGMTGKRCTEFCSSKGFTYAGTEWSKECYCGNKISNGGTGKLVDPLSCSSVCSGSVTENCGGDRLLTLYQKTKKRHLDGVSRLDIRGH